MVGFLAGAGGRSGFTLPGPPFERTCEGAPWGSELCPLPLFSVSVKGTLVHLGIRARNHPSIHRLHLGLSHHLLLPYLSGLISPTLLLMLL